MEPLEDLLAVLWGDPGAVVTDLDDGPLVLTPDRDLDGATRRCVRENVTDEVGQDLAQAGFVSGDDEVAVRHVSRAREGHKRRRTRGVDRSEVGEGVARDHGQVHPLTVEGLALFEASQGEEVLHEAAHRDRGALNPVHRLGDLGGRSERTHAVELAVTADRDQGGAQFMARIGDKLAHAPLGARLHLEGVFNLAEHDVERSRKRAHLGARGHGRDALAKVPGGDRARRRFDCAQRLQGAPDRDIPGDPAENGDAQAGEGKDLSQLRRRAVDVS